MGWFFFGDEYLSAPLPATWPRTQWVEFRLVFLPATPKGPLLSLEYPCFSPVCFHRALFPLEFHRHSRRRSSPFLFPLNFMTGSPTFGWHPTWFARSGPLVVSLLVSSSFIVLFWLFLGTPPVSAPFSVQALFTTDTLAHFFLNEPLCPSIS